MVGNSSVKSLVKILIGAAWIDGTIQPEERQYLRQIAQQKGVANDPDIKPWLYELLPVKSEQCYNWVREYMGDHPTNEEYQNLIEVISRLIYSDAEVATEEARLLSKLQDLSNDSDQAHTKVSHILKQIQKLYRRWVDVQN